MSKPNHTQQADHTLDKLTQVMERNKQHQTPAMVTAAVQASAVRPQPSTPAVLQARIRRNSTGIRLKPDEEERVRAILRQGLALNETLTLSDALKIALMEYHPRNLTPAAVQALRIKDGRAKRAASARNAA
jgi:hypothetical protein